MRRVGRAKTINTKYCPEERENFIQAQVPSPARLHEAMFYTVRLLPHFYCGQRPFPEALRGAGQSKPVLYSHRLISPQLYERTLS